MTPFDDPNVKQAFSNFPAKQRTFLLKLRALIFDVAKNTENVGVIDETLRWGQPAYLTKQPKSGTTIRLGLTHSEKCAMFTHCQTTVVSDFRSLFPNDFEYDGNRALIIANLSDPNPLLRQFVSSALTYHVRS